MEKNTFYITTPIYYPSGRFHLGTAYTTVLADTIKKYKVQRGYDARMLTGLDEHGQKVEQVAIKRGLTPQEHVDEIAMQAKKLWKLMDVRYDDFIRTTEERHTKVVEKIFDKFMEQGDIYKGEYEGWYCMPCETYFTETQLVDGKCPDCGREVKKMKEEAYFFNMKKYQKKIEEFYEKNPNFIMPESRKNELFNNFIKPGLEDLCVTRTTFDWGIKVPKDPKHIVYVWLDALTNYITALGYMSDDDTLFKKYWPADLQIVGKDIIRFHGIYWPIFLMALGLEPPKRIYAHGFLMMKDGKMSKSKGNIVYPEMLVERYGLDATRYFLLKEFPYGQDAIFTPEDFVNKYNFDLCNDLGNLLNRTIGMINKYFGGNIEEYTGNINVVLDENQNEINVDEELENVISKKIKEYEENMENLHFSNALGAIWEIIARANKYIDQTAPWTLAKQEEKEKLASVMYHLVETLRIVAILIKPAMEDTSCKIFKQLGIPENMQEYNTIYNFGKELKNIKVIEKGEPLFLRLEQEEEINYIKEQMQAK